MTYTHLSREERYQIYSLKKARHSQKQIAWLLQRSPATICRELRRNSDELGYRPKWAHWRAGRCKANNARHKCAAIWQFVRDRLSEQWSPELISYFAAVSHEAIYQHIYADKQADGALWQHLRCYKSWRRRRAKPPRREVAGRGGIPGRRGIEQRPALVDERSRIGDWEVDTVIGHAHKQAIVSLVERKSGFLLIRKVPRKTAQAVRKAVVALLKPYQSQVHTITSDDNGRELTEHALTSKRLKADFYFAHPYASWERGSNENSNGLIRQYFPKNRDFRTITQKEIDMVMHRLNNRPRKRLGFKTPAQSFFNSAVALLELNPPADKTSILS